MDTIFLNGKWVSQEGAVVSVFDRGFMFGDSVYEVLAVTNGKICALRAHVSRLKASLDAVGINLKESIDDISDLLIEAVRRSEKLTGLLYLQITRGEQFPRDHTYPLDLHPTILITFSERRDLGWAEVKPIKVVTKSDFRWGRGDIKVTSLIANVILRNSAIREGYDDAILIRDDIVTEATAANVFLVKDGEIVTPKKNQFFLHGITRDIVLELCKELDLCAVERDVRRTELFEADEIWLSSTGKELCPVLSIDGDPVGDGFSRENSLWKKLHCAYQLKIKNGIG